ncbi:hypothetical protein CLIB1444_15S01552 [[Candida] jaroonii]|uniref:Uncharacterized protein n=1 Tax=[Candida] jaroonii TaxID=467808 RepID=A0ACA9YFX0_9ASCO|nr:hypothetical protein CLIB1444_15S01552 [[Candida] jaroonii]
MWVWVDWTVIYSVEVVVFILTLILTFYRLIANYKNIRDQGLLTAFIFSLYPSFWQILAASMGLVWYTKESWKDVWFILNIFFEILGTGFSLVQLEVIVNAFYTKTETKASVFRYLILFLVLTASVLSLVGVIQIRTTFIYYQAGSTILAASIIFFLGMLVGTFKVNTKFIGMIFFASILLLASSCYFMYLAFGQILTFQYANYILFVILQFVVKFLVFGISQLLINQLL